VEWGVEGRRVVLKAVGERRVEEGEERVVLKVVEGEEERVVLKVVGERRVEEGEERVVLKVVEGEGEEAQE
jgi:hypothetical protein